MLQFGFRPVKYAISGHPTRFVKKDPLTRRPLFVIQRTLDRTWRVARFGVVPGKGAGGGLYYPERGLGAPTFPGPVAAALWLEVEVASGSVPLTS